MLLNGIDIKQVDLNLEVAFSMTVRAIYTKLSSVYEGTLTSREKQTSSSYNIIIKVDEHSQILKCFQISWQHLQAYKEWHIGIFSTLANELKLSTNLRLSQGQPSQLTFTTISSRLFRKKL